MNQKIMPMSPIRALVTLSLGLRETRSLTLLKAGEGAPDAEQSAEGGVGQVGLGQCLDLPVPPVEPRRVVGVRSHTASMRLAVENASHVSFVGARPLGAALLALGVACWLARSDTTGPAQFGLIARVLVYDAAAALLLAYAGLYLSLCCAGGLVGRLRWR
jgi:hypothetical protein